MPHMNRVKLSLKKILDNSEGAVESKDRISLISFAKNVRRIFTLVEKDQNFVQLRNQVKKLEADTWLEAQLGKALKLAVQEFSKGIRQDDVV